MRRRLDVAASLITSPSLLFLDEPSTGLDPRSRNHVWQVIRNAVARGTTVVLTTQYLEEADQLADRIAVIDHGAVIAEGTRADLKASVGAGQVRIRLRDPAERPLAAHLLSESFGAPVEDRADPAELTVRTAPDHENVPGEVTTALTDLDQAGIRVSDFSFGQPSLDEVFLALTGRRSEADHNDASNDAREGGLMSTTTQPIEPDTRAFSNDAAPAPSGPVPATLAFAWRAILKIKHVPEQLADVIGIPVLFTLLFTYLFGGALAGSTTDYLRYLLPGTLVLALVFLGNWLCCVYTYLVQLHVFVSR